MQHLLDCDIKNCDWSCVRSFKRLQSVKEKRYQLLSQFELLSWKRETENNTVVKDNCTRNRGVPETLWPRSNSSPPATTSAIYLFPRRPGQWKCYPSAEQWLHRSVKIFPFKRLLYILPTAPPSHHGSTAISPKE